MSQGRILVVDDEKLILWSLKEYLQSQDYEVETVDSATAAGKAVETGRFDLVLLDYKLPDGDGISLTEQWRQEERDFSVIMVTAHSSVEHAVRALQAGASDYVAKPFNNEDIGHRVSKVLETGRLRREVLRLRQEQLQRFRFDRIIGKSDAMAHVFELVDRIVPLVDTTILITGESGTGKDLLAKAIHFGGPRSEGPYVNITCTALPETLLESELFGHEKGAFTDAKAQKIGLVEKADGGTLFLDEIGDMSLYLQSKLLRFLEEKAFRRVGGNSDLKVDLRVIAATNRDLKKRVAAGEFREDLYFRLKVIPIELPPLRDREGDVPILVEHFVEEFNTEFKKSVKKIAPKLMASFEAYDWPGNVRELRNAVERAMILGRGETLSGDGLPLQLFDESSSETSDGGLQLTRRGVDLQALERDLVAQALQLTHGNQTRAGKLLGLNRDQIRYRMEKFGLRVAAGDGEANGE